MLLLVASAVFAEPAGWLNTDWAYRSQLSVLSQEERQGALVEWDVDFSEILARVREKGAFDLNSPRVTRLKSGQEYDMPCRFIPEKDASSKGRLFWLRPGVMPPATEETYFIYFDTGNSKPAKLHPELASVKPIVGKNLLVNSSFTIPDQVDASRPAGWNYYTPGTDADTNVIEWVENLGHSGGRALKLSNFAGGATVMASQTVQVDAGKRYALCGWIKKEGESQGFVGLTTFFYGTGGQAVSGVDGAYSNYKIQVVHRGQSQWAFVFNSNINVCDPKTKLNGLLDADRTLPGTVLAKVHLSVENGKGVAYFSDVEFREIPRGAPLSIWITAVEKKGK